jgi:dimethylhistidine N-methyltransferase
LNGLELGTYLRSGESVAGEVLRGLLSEPKSLPSKYLYDSVGSRLFEAICSLPEYYVTRTEIALLERHAPDISALVPDESALVEFGSGSSVKGRILLSACPQLRFYVPIDISETAVVDTAHSIRADFPSLHVIPLVEDFTTMRRLPPTLDDVPTTGFFPGSTIGNFSPREAVGFLRNARALLRNSSCLIVGADLTQSPGILIPAYNDARGVTAAFNKNLLVRLNREFDADFDPEHFDHRAIWNSGKSRIEMHLVSRRKQRVTIAGEAEIRFEKGETIHTENSYKYEPKVLLEMAHRVGWRTASLWSSIDPDVGIFVFAAE